MAQIATYPDRGPDKRRHQRVDINLPATLVTGHETTDVEAVVMNFAPGGVFVRSATQPPCGARIELHFRMLGDRLCEAAGHVVRHDEERGGFAVSFDQANPAMESFTHHLIKLPSHLHAYYLADVLHPEVRILPTLGIR